MPAAPVLLSAVLTLLAMGSGAIAASAPTRSLPCDPPLDRPLKLTLAQHLWGTDGHASRVTVARILRFSRDRDGLHVAAHIAELATDQPEPQHERMLLAYGAPGDVPVVIRLDAAMAIVGIDSLDARWADFRRRQAILAGLMESEGVGKRAAAIGVMLAQMGQAEQVGMLSAFLAPVLHHCGVMLPIEATTDAEGSILLEKRKESAQMTDISRYAVDPRTSLLRVLDRRLTTAAAPLRPLQEQWTLDPIN